MDSKFQITEFTIITLKSYIKSESLLQVYFR